MCACGAVRRSHAVASSLVACVRVVGIPGLNTSAAPSLALHARRGRVIRSCCQTISVSASPCDGPSSRCGSHPAVLHADPKVLHNIAITEYLEGGGKELRKLLSVLEKLKQGLEDAKSEAESVEGASLNDALSDADSSLTAYNTAVLQALGSPRAHHFSPACPLVLSLSPPPHTTFSLCSSTPVLI